MSDTEVGVLIDDQAERDAIHIAVAPAMAVKKLYPGQAVGVQNGLASDEFDPIGIVDPFLPRPVFPDDRFYVFLKPRTITGLRHHWSHPAFPDSDRQPDLAVEDSEVEATPRGMTVMLGARSSDIPAVDLVAGQARQRSEQWMRNFSEELGPGYDAVMAQIREYVAHPAGNPGYLRFGTDTSRWEIPSEFWHHAEVILGQPMPANPDDLPEHFSCSC